MRKIINGKSYDTNTAKLIGSRDNGEYGGFDFISESLYLKRTGEYFLHGRGGARTCYARYVGAESWCGGEQIIPLNLTSASSWAEKNLTADEYEAAFGEVSE